MRWGQVAILDRTLDMKDLEGWPGVACWGTNGGGRWELLYIKNSQEDTTKYVTLIIVFFCSWFLLTWLTYATATQARARNYLGLDCEPLTAIGERVAPKIRSIYFSGTTAGSNHSPVIARGSQSGPQFEQFKINLNCNLKFIQIAPCEI